MSANKLQVLSSPGFGAWLREQGGSLALSTYQAGKLFLIGTQSDGRLSLFERSFERCMGLWCDGQSLWLAAAWQLWKLENALEAGARHEGYDRVFVPQLAYTTGALDVHDLSPTEAGLTFVNTLFSCLATPSTTHSFKPVWRPPWVSQLAPEDRCHLNGMAASEGRATHVTATARTDATQGWRAHKRDGGVVYDLHRKQVICEGLSMPHSPRVHEGRVWLLEAGTGRLGRVDESSGRFEAVCEFPGFTRGLSFHGKYALVGTSVPRHGTTFDGLALADRLAAKKETPRCGVSVVDTERGVIVEHLEFRGIVGELYDVVFVPGVERPMAIGIKGEEIRHSLSIEG